MIQVRFADVASIGALRGFHDSPMHASRFPLVQGHLIEGV
jgi:hypothetical protein